MNLLVAGPGFINRIGNTVGTDFGSCYAAGVLAREGKAAALYDRPTLRATHSRVMGRPVADYSWAYPPPILLALAPLSLLPFVPALWIWLALTIGLLVLAVTSIARYPATPVLVLLFPAVTQAAITGPTGTLTGALFAGAIAYLPGRPGIAGVMLALLSYKPHLFLLLPVCMLAGREWRLAATVLSGVLLLVLGSGLAFGVDAWIRFFTEAPGHIEHVVQQHFPWTRMPTVFVAVLHATADIRLASAAQGLSFVGVALACLYVWTVSADLFARSLTFGAGAFLATPYAYDYDCTLLLAPFALLVRQNYETGLTGRVYWALVAIWIAPHVVWLCSTLVGQQVGPILFAGLLVYAVREAARTRGAALAP
jgi:hypothetical protein